MFEFTGEIWGFYDSLWERPDCGHLNSPEFSLIHFDIFCKLRSEIFLVLYLVTWWNIIIPWTSCLNSVKIFLTCWYDMFFFPFPWFNPEPEASFYCFIPLTNSPDSFKTMQSFYKTQCFRFFNVACIIIV